ncbi:hypothetical protein [Streptomyces chartreusis]|uniref:hypothetical protein n=1 Tax=Streptomyces chartreusis TaxID=1969 RepID=UPI0033D1A0EC
MIFVAVLLLPMMGMLLYGMDLMEGWLFGKLPRARHRRGRRLRLIHGAGSPADRRASGRHRDAA